MARKSSVDDVLPLSPMQEGMLFHALFDEHAPDVYTGQLILELAGPLDAARLRTAAEALLVRHPNLRAAFRALSSGAAVQVVRGDVVLPWREIDLATLPAAERDAEFERIADADRGQRFDPARPPLLRCTLVRLGERWHKLVIASHHLLWDGWSAPILVRELGALYAAHGNRSALPPVRPYRDYLSWLSTVDTEASGQAWRDALAGLDEPTLLAGESSGHPPDVPRTHTTTIPESTTAGLVEAAKAYGLTTNTVLQGLWAVLLSKLTGNRDVTFGATVSGRPPELTGVESMVGLFINTLPVRSRPRPDEPLSAFLRRLQAEQAELFDHQHLGLGEIQRTTGHATLFDTLLVLESYPLDEDRIGADLAAEGVRLAGISVHDATHYPLTIIVRPGARLSLTFGYQPTSFDAEYVAAIAGWFACVLAEFVAAPDQPTGRVDLAPSTELAALAVAGAGPRQDTPTPVRELLAERARAHPGRDALVFAGSVLSYAELDERAEQMADVLVSRGAGPESVVAVALPRSTELVVAMLAVFKAGAVYLSVDVGYPVERITLMLGDARPLLVVCERDFAERHGIEPARRVDVTDTSDRQTRPEVLPGHPAYLVFTSGSTGRPKGVLGTQRGLANRLQWGRTAVAVHGDPATNTETPGVRVAKSPVSFIDGTTELLTGLAAGETVVLAGEDAAADPFALLELVRRHRVELVTAVPSLLTTMLGEATAADLAPVATWITSGEALPASLTAEIAERCPGATVVNLYGCSEAAGDSLAEFGAAGDGAIGRPIANTTAYVLDRFLRPVPAGITGELYLAGHGLARGYLNDPAMTARRFVADPFGPPGSVMYRTGDRARRLPGGSFEFAGRADEQVKIHGFRVEPGEVENVARNVPGVRQAAVVARGHTPGDQQLVAYLLPEPGSEIDGQGVRRELAATLPAHLVPAAVVVLAELPRTPSGKLDRRALPAPDFAELTTRTAPRTATEETLCRLVAGVLGLESVGVHDNFFELGGNSVVSVRLVSKARGAGLTFAPRDVFACQTVAELAKAADPGRDGGTDPVAAGEAAGGTGQARQDGPDEQPLVSLSAAQRDKVLSRWRS